jgi:serine/threonine-protein kinase
VSDAPSRLAAALADRYRLERELGQGGMATVYLAEDLKHGRKVAIKVLHPELSAVLGGERFLAEIKLTASLQHPHILGLIDSGECDGLLYYVMPFIDGETLRARLARETQLPVKDAVRLATEVAGALEFAHKRGIVHRDIKPENILLQDGRALVADFGIALAVQQAGGQRMTQTGLSLGTPSYMSPEQAMGEKAVDARTDVYALGAMTYEMLQGDPPFTGSSAQAIMAQLLTSRPKPIREFRSSVPAHVEQAVMTALEKLPADRQPSAAEFARQLETDGGHATAATGARTLALPSATPVTASRRTLAPLALALLAVGALAGWGMARLGRTSAPAEVQPTVTSLLPPSGGTFAERRSMALSPDGRRLAVVVTAGDGTRSLWLRHLDRLDAEPLQHTVGADMPFWSPDGRTLGFFADGYVTVLDENGEARRLCPAPAASAATWGAKGVIVFGYRGGLTSVSAAGGPCTAFMRSDSAAMFSPSFLPDGERLVVTRGRFLDAIVTDLTGRSLATLPIRAVGVLVAPPDYLVASRTSDARALDIQRFDLRTLTLQGTPVRLASGVRTSSGVPTITVAKDVFAYLPATGDRPYLEYDANGLLADTVRVEMTWTLGVRPAAAGPARLALAGQKMWLYDLDADRATRLAMHDSSTVGVNPVFNAQGTRLVYTAASTTTRGQCRIMERDLTTDAERTIARDSTFLSYTCPSPLDWSADGTRLLVRTDTLLQVVRLDGSAPPQLISRPGRIWEGRFSPDGRSVAFSSDETGRAEVYVQALTSGVPARVSREGGRWPFWTQGGRALTFLTPDGRVQEAAVGNGTDGGIGTPRTKFAAPTWRRSMFDDPGSGFAVMGDGERFIVRQSPSGLAVALVQHWPALVRHADSTGAGR